MAKRRRRSLIDAPAISRTPAPAPGRSGRLAPPQATDGGSVDDIEAVLAKEHGGAWTPPAPPNEPEPTENAEAAAPDESDSFDAPAMPPAPDLEQETGSSPGDEAFDLAGGQESFDLFGMPDPPAHGDGDDDTMAETLSFADHEAALAHFDSPEGDPDEEATQAFDRDAIPEDLAMLMDEEDEAGVEDEPEEPAPRLSKGIPEGFPTEDDAQSAPGEPTIQLASTNTPTMDRAHVPEAGLPEASAYAEPEPLAVGDVPEPDSDEDLQEDTFEMDFFSNDNWDERMDDLPEVIATRAKPVPPPSMATMMATALSSVIVAVLVLGFAASMVKADRDAAADRVVQEERAARASVRAQAAEEARIRKEMLARPAIDLSGDALAEEEPPAEDAPATEGSTGAAPAPRRTAAPAQAEPTADTAPTKPLFFTPAPSTDSKPAPSSGGDDKRGLFRRKK